MPKVTHIQHEQIQMLQDVQATENFHQFLSKAYTIVSDLFNMYKVAPKKNKCNWCRLCAHMQMIFSSASYRELIMKAFNATKIHTHENAICTRIFFNLLEIVSTKEATQLKEVRLQQFVEEGNCDTNLDALDKSSLRYIAGATIHAVRSKLQDLSLKQVMNAEYKAKLNHRKHQLTHLISEKTLDPDSLRKLIQQDYGGLLYVTDETFTFFKLLLLQTRKLQNIASIQIDPQSVFSRTFHTLIQDVELIAAWFKLFATSENFTESCECEENTGESIQLSCSELVELELDQTLILDLFKGIVHYFCKVHCAEKVDQLKDYVLEKPKTFQLRHTLDENPKKSQESIVQFPCGVCAKECIDIIHKKKAAFEDFSMQCDKCNKWYHYICVNLTGHEPALQDNSEIPYYCNECKLSSDHVDAVADELENMDVVTEISDSACVEENEVVSNASDCKGRGRGCGRGRSNRGGRGRERSTASTKVIINNVQSATTASTSQETFTSISSRRCKRKAVNHDDYVT